MVTARREEKKNSCRFQCSILNWRQKFAVKQQTTDGGGEAGGGAGGYIDAY